MSSLEAICQSEVDRNCLSEARATGRHLLTSATLKSFLRKQRSTAIKLMVGSGLVGLRQLLTGRKNMILTFHRICPDGENLDPYDTCPSLPVGIFRQLLEYVGRTFETTSLRNLVDGDKRRKPAVTVTFDDGWRDNYDLAFPILHEYGIPATVFVVTGKIGLSQPFWQQKLGHLFRRATDHDESSIVSEMKVALGIESAESLSPGLYRKTVKYWKALETPEREDRLCRAGEIAPAGCEADRIFLSEAEIREMSNLGIEFGSHTISHAILPRQSSHIIENELRESKSALEAIVGEQIEQLAYPNGDWSDEVVQIAKSCGYRIACTTRNARVSVDDDRMLLSRVEPEWDFADRSVAAFNKERFEWLAK